MSISAYTAHQPSASKGKYRGICHNDTCNVVDAKFFSRNTNAYFCRECAYALHKAAKKTNTIDYRVVQFEDDQLNKFVSVDTVKSDEERELLYNRRIEMRMASEWYRWNHR